MFVVIHNSIISFASNSKLNLIIIDIKKIIIIIKCYLLFYIYVETIILYN